MVDDDPEGGGADRRHVSAAWPSTVLRAYGGREAIELARRELPDLIVLDLMMPEVNGFDVVEALNEQADTARIPDHRGHRQADHRRGPHQAEWLRDRPSWRKAEFDRDRFAAGSAARHAPVASWSADMAKILVVEDNSSQHDAGGLPAAIGRPCRAQRDGRRGGADAGARRSSRT